MTAVRKSMLTIATLALAGIFASTAKAQSGVANGHFTLPFEAKWAGTVLPAGDYTMSVVSVSDSRPAAYSVRFAGAGKENTILAVRSLGPEVSGGSKLVAVRSGGKYRIRALHLAKVNIVLTFAAPKGEQTLIAEAPELITSVPILVASK
jgi:hypothetical protein